MRGSAEGPRKICAERFGKEGDREGARKRRRYIIEKKIYNIQSEGATEGSIHSKKQRRRGEKGVQAESDDTPTSGATSTREEGARSQGRKQENSVGAKD